MEIGFHTFDHVVALKKVAEQHIPSKCSICNSFQVISEVTYYGKY